MRSRFSQNRQLQITHLRICECIANDIHAAQRCAKEIEMQHELERIKQRASAGILPSVATVAPDTHVFHFEEDKSKWTHGHILFVNKNGNQFRLIREKKEWVFVKTWRNVFAVDEWERVKRLRNVDPIAVMQLCGTGPQGTGTFETLCLLPKDLTRRRKAVWRDTLLDVQFDMDNNRFAINPHDRPNVKAWFTGKLWESEDASRWCLKNLGEDSAPFIPPAQKAVIAAAEALVLEDIPGWGSF